ncbi:nucleoside-diphosphate-sugar epimerase [Actinoplanes tereljensis]|uniref:Dihydroflavonol-4-reductase n=1 Tax=Paractinoplanes tereljensis TaxID=571912 RepID=A0A919TSN5_9ACTN|nr:NAD-dependent epimerase/dehydratase family protein [Actinoplanes tereljensis]GIF20419.1 dihydroflavonol-4-reductase [Actinoplanes tereljensis]
MADTVLVTGGSGFVGSHLVRQLLGDGYAVRATVRDPGDPVKTAPLRRLGDEFPGRLELFRADLLQPGSFDDAVAGCRVVFHVASPFLMPEKISDGRNQVLEPALQGTRNVLEALAKSSSVERLVLTSTVGAIFGDYVDVEQMAGRTLSERYFNTSSTLANNPYHFAKVQAEQEAWRLVGAQDRFDMVVLNPGLILGPSFTPASDSGSLFLMNELMSGYFFYGAANFSFTLVDVRDVALAHVRAAALPSASGRYILARPEMVSFQEMGTIIRDRYPRHLRLPRHQVPDWAVRVLGPRFGLTPDYIRKHLGIRFPVDNHRSVDELGLTYRPAAETVLDHYESWRSHRAARRSASR